MNDLDQFRDWDAAYVLGALSSDERRMYEKHIEQCAACSTAVTKLAGIPGFLAKISPDQASEIVESPLFERESRTNVSSIQKLAARAIQKRHALRRRVLSGMAVAAAFLMVIGVGIGVHIQENQANSASAFTTLAPGTPISFVRFGSDAMQVKMQMASKKWGTQFQWNCTYTENRTESQEPESYDLVVTDPSGAKIVVATWREIGKAAAGLVAATSIPTSNIRAIEIRTTGDSNPILKADI